jgi:hypothetical protein
MQDMMPIEKEIKSRNIPENSFLYQYKYTCVMCEVENSTLFNVFQKWSWYTAVKLGYNAWSLR